MTMLADQPEWLQALVGLAVLALAAAAVNFLVKKVILRFVGAHIDRRNPLVDKAASRLANIFPALIVSRGIMLVPYLPDALAMMVQNIARATIILSIALAIGSMLDYANQAYQRQPQSHNRPIKGYLQLAKIVLFLGVGVLILALLMDQSPLLLLSGFGAMAAVLMLVFKDTILSLVASVQLTSNDMIRVGDWIEMPQLNADGDVIDIALHTVKVQNWDKTITTIPTYRLIEESFRNWRGMSEAGARRIKRPLMIDQDSIRFLEPEEVEKLRRFRLLDEYLASKDEEIGKWNEGILGEGGDPVNARRLTNIGTYRAYLSAYLKADDRLSREYTTMVRQREPTSLGLPLEVYCWTATTKWTEYEAIQSDLFDHFLSIMPEFGLSIYQE